MLAVYPLCAAVPARSLLIEMSFSMSGSAPDWLPYESVDSSQGIVYDPIAERGWTPRSGGHMRARALAFVLIVAIGLVLPARAQDDGSSAGQPDASAPTPTPAPTVTPRPVDILLTDPLTDGATGVL